jgi:hypothetical protein
VLVVLRSSGTGVVIWHSLGTQIYMRLARINILELTRAYQGAIAIAIAANVSATSVFADLPSVLPRTDTVRARNCFARLVRGAIISLRTEGLEIGMHMQGT